MTQTQQDLRMERLEYTLGIVNSYAVALYHVEVAHDILRRVEEKPAAFEANALRTRRNMLIGCIRDTVEVVLGEEEED